MLGNINKNIKTNGDQMVNLKINNTKLDVVKLFKCLGLIIDDKLSFGDLLDYLCKKN